MIHQVEPTSATRAWHQVLKSCLDFGDKSSPRGQASHELLGVMTLVDMTRPCVFSRHRKVSPRFACGETLWYWTGSNELSDIVEYAPSYGRFSDDGKTLFGAYGPRIMSQLDYVINKLREDNDTRQAVWNIWRENPPASKDIPCSLSTQFMVRNGKLHCFHTMRSSDAWVGFIYDVFSFCVISALIALRLRELGLNVDLGTLFLTVGSQHLYHRNKAGAEEVLSLIDTDHPGDEWRLCLDDYDSRSGLVRDLYRGANVNFVADRVQAWLSQWRLWHERC